MTLTPGLVLFLGIIFIAIFVLTFFAGNEVQGYSLGNHLTEAEKIRIAEFWSFVVWGSLIIGCGMIIFSITVMRFRF
jgi:hypothetical protein